jgi:HTH-type transcriptional regulator/antitoxin HigA
MTTRIDSKRDFDPDHAVPPGETIADLLEEGEMTQAELAQRLGVSAKHVNQVVNGVASISAELALGLEKVFGVPADFWVARESIYRARLARRQESVGLEGAVEWARKFPIADLKRLGLIPSDARGSELVAAVLRFFGIASPDQWTPPAVAFRKSQKFASDVFALAAWLRVGALEAHETRTKPFEADRFRGALEHARGLTRVPPDEWEPTLKEACAAAGVVLVIQDTFPKVRANGATQWLSPTKAVLQLSLRYKWEDIFWFSFFHEAGHILLHRKKVFVDEPKRLTSKNATQEVLDIEEEANRFAARTLIPATHDRRLRELSFAEVPAFARQLGIASAIVVGRLQHDRGDYSKGNHLRRRFTFVSD